MFKEIVIFTSDMFDLSLNEEEEDPNIIPLGEDVAEFLIDKLKKCGIEVSEAFEDECGWDIDITIQKQKYTAYIHWAPLGRKDEKAQDYWVIQLNTKKSLLKSLFGKYEVDYIKLEPLCNIVHKILADERRISNIKWLDLSEFSKIY
ncbi:MAG TPA: hypothetical protein VF941_12565 [Clostridia bacterium]